MDERTIARNALIALSLSSNIPDADRKACNFAVNSMFNIQAERKTTLSTPARVLWKLTGQCNANCVHCWASLGKRHKPSDLRRTAYDIVDMDVMMVSLSGGEPFLCPEIYDIIDILKRNNTIIEIMSNGSLIDDEVALRLAQCLDLDTDVVQISLDGSTSQIHDRQRNKRIFDAAVAGIKCLKKRSIKVRAAFCTTTINQYDIFNTYRLANELEVETFSVVPVFAFRKGDTEVNELDYANYFSQLARCREFESANTTQLRLHANQQYQYLINKYYTDLPSEFTDYMRRDRESYVVQPNETNSFVQIDAQGEAVPGPEWDISFSGGNVYEQGLKEIWEMGRNWEMFRAGRDLRNTKCSNCRVYALCEGGNMKYAYDTYGTINAPDGTCRI